ncbi:MAG: hypothetical protein ACLFUO_05665, partial [Candidatus Woesearchaeota archaeon]
NMAEFILSLHKDAKAKTQKVVFDTDFLRKYISYAKKTMKPELTRDAIDEIKKYYVKMRGSGGDEDGVKAIPISARQLEALIRLSEASAKLRFSKYVETNDAKRAIDLVHNCLSQVGMDPKTGKIDIDRISTGITASQRGNISNIKNIINELEKSVGKTIPVEDIVEMAKQKGIEESTVTEAVEKLKRSGDIFEPRRGFISKL